MAARDDACNRGKIVFDANSGCFSKGGGGNDRSSLGRDLVRRAPVAM